MMLQLKEIRLPGGGNPSCRAVSLLMPLRAILAMRMALGLLKSLRVTLVAPLLAVLLAILVSVELKTI